MKAIVVPHAGYPFRPTAALCLSGCCSRSPTRYAVSSCSADAPGRRRGAGNAHGRRVCDAAWRDRNDRDAAALIADPAAGRRRRRAARSGARAGGQLPFLQTVLPDFKLFAAGGRPCVGGCRGRGAASASGRPGNADRRQLGSVALLPYDVAREIDGRTAAHSCLRPDHQPRKGGATPPTACSGRPPSATASPPELSTCATRRYRRRPAGGLSAMAALPSAEAPMRDDAIGPELLRQARSAIAHRFGAAAPVVTPATAARLQEPGAPVSSPSPQHGQLRGCIGSLQAWRPLAEDVRETPSPRPSATRVFRRSERRTGRHAH